MFPILIKVLIIIKSALCVVIIVRLVIHTPDVLVILYCFTETDSEIFFILNNVFFNFPDSFSR